MSDLSRFESLFQAARNRGLRERDHRYLEEVLFGGPARGDVTSWFSLAGRTESIDGLTEHFCLRRAWTAINALQARSFRDWHRPDSPTGVGALVTLGRHREVDGSANWSPTMDAFVGRIATVVGERGTDESGCAVVSVDIDEGRHMWRVESLEEVDEAKIEQLKKELTRRLALVYEKYGAEEEERAFLQKLYDADALEVRMRLRLTYLLFRGSIEDCDRAEEILVTEGVPVVDDPPPGDYSTDMALATATDQLHKAGRYQSMLRLLAERREFMEADDAMRAKYVEGIATAMSATNETLHREIEQKLGLPPLIWWQQLYDALLREQGADNMYSATALVRSAACMSDLPRVWAALAIILPGYTLRMVASELDEVLTDHGLLLERSACRFVSRVSSDSYELLVEEGLRLAGSIPSVPVTNLVVQAMVDLLDCRRADQQATTADDEMLKQVIELQRDWEPDRRPDLQARLRYAIGEVEEAWEIFERLPAGQLPDAEQLLVHCWFDVHGGQVDGEFDLAALSSLPDRLRDGGLMAVAMLLLLDAGRLRIVLDDPEAAKAVLLTLEDEATSLSQGRLRVLALRHVGKIARRVGDAEIEAGLKERAAATWSVALSTLSEAINQSVGDDDVTSAFGRKGRLLREEIELEYRQLLREMRTHALDPEGEGDRGALLPTVSQMLGQAEELHRSGDSNGAVELLESVGGLQYLPSARRAQALDRAAAISMDIKDPERALADWRRSLELVPENPALRAHFLDVAIAERRWKEAEFAVTHGIEVIGISDPTLARQVARARVACLRGRIERAADLLQVACALETLEETCELVARAVEADGDEDRAEDLRALVYAEMLDRHATSLYGLRAGIRLALLDLDAEAALRITDQLEELPGVTTSEVEHTLDFFAGEVEREHPDLALALRERLLAMADRSHGAGGDEYALAARNLVRLHLRVGRFADAEKLCRLVIASDEAGSRTEGPDVAQRLDDLALVLLAQDELDEAREVLERAWAATHALGDVVTARILWTCSALSLVRGRDPEASLAALKPMVDFELFARHRTMFYDWDVGGVLGAIENRLDEDSLALLTTLSDALAGRLARRPLDGFPVWRNLEPVAPPESLPA